MPQSSPNERRRQPRFSLQGAVEIWRGGKRYMVSELGDISMCGCYLNSEFQTLRLGEEIDVAVRIFNPDVTFRCSAVVRTSDPGVGMGIEFRFAGGEDSTLRTALDEAAQSKTDSSQ